MKNFHLLFKNKRISAVIMALILSVFSLTVLADDCIETASASGLDSDPVFLEINSFPCVGSGTITAMTLDATIGPDCPSWYSYNIIVNGAEIATQQCDQAGYDLTSYLPVTSVILVSNDEDGFSDDITLSLTLNITFSQNCTETNSATGNDSDPTTVTISSFPCAGGGAITGMTLDGTIGANCPSWYSYDIIVNGATIATQQCDQTGYDLAAYLPVTSVSLQSNDENATSDNITLVLTLHIDFYSSSCPDPTTQTVANITTVSADLGWTESGTATTWDIEWGPAGFTQGSGTMITGTTTNPHSLSGLSANTPYDWYVRADCGGGSYSNWVGPHTFTTTCNAITSFPWTEDFTGTQNCWTVLDENNDSYLWNLDYTLDYNSAPEVAMIYTELNYGNNDDFMITPQLTLPVNQQLIFWYKIHSTFLPNDFEVLLSTTGNAAADFTTTLVANASYGNTSYQEMIVDLSAYSGNVYIAWRVAPGGLDGWRLYIDDVTVEDAPACPDPTAQTETTITSTSADLGWTENGSATNWEIEWGLTGFTQGSGTMVTANTNPHTLGGLSVATTYDWYLRADCAAGGGTGQSNWIGPCTFTTACNPNTTFPWLEDFEGAFLPACWSKIINQGNDITQTSDQNATPGGTYSAMFSSYYESSDYNQYLFTGPQTINANYTHLSFWHLKYNTSAELFQWGVATTTNPGDYNWTTVTLSSTAWQQTTVDLTPWIGQDVYIGFHYYGEYLYFVYLDDVSIDAPPACPDPTEQTETNITSVSADLGWTENGPATTWDILWGLTGFDPGTGGTMVSTTTDPHTLSGLSPATTYDWYVSSDCGGGSYSNWAGPGVFTTTCSSTALPYFENFDGVTAPDFPQCLIIENTNGDAYTWETNSTCLSPPNSAYIRYNSSLNMDDWFFTRGLDLTGGVTYEVGFAYAAAHPDWPENLSVDWGDGASSTAMSGSPIFTHLGIDGGWYVGSATFTPAVTGTYYVGFHGHSDANKYNLYVDDISVIGVVAATSWTGATDNDWYKTSNWSGGIPTSGTDVTIAAGATNYPTVNTLAQCGSILTESGASLLDNGLLITSSATVERAYSGNQWHLISSPVTGPVSGMFTGLFLQTHDEVSNTYSDVVAPDVPLTPGQGFALWNQNGNATAGYTGSLTWSATRALTRTAAGDTRGWNLVGNPYPSSIDWEATSGWTKTNVAASTYRFDGGGSGNWAVWNGTTGINGATQYIASGQGFFVSVNDDGSTTGTLTFTNDVRVHDNTAFFKEEPADIVKLKVSGNNYYDETAVYFREEATVGFDNEMDARKLPGFEDSAPNIYSTTNEGMAINVLPEVSSVPMNVNVGLQTGTYTIETVSNGEFNNLYLEDLSTGAITDLNTSSYTFGYIPGIESRFVLHFNTLGIEHSSGELYNIYSFNKAVYVAVPINTNGTITVYDMMGQEVTKAPINSTVNTITLERSAYYVVKVLGNENIVTKKVFIK